MLKSMNALQKFRSEQLPEIPPFLKDPAHVNFVADTTPPEKHERIAALFPLTHGQAVLKAQRGEKRTSKPLQIAALFSGGQAAGGHNVIIGILHALKKLHPESRLFGFLDGPGGLIAGKSIELTADRVAPYLNQGGFDMIGSGRTKIETEEQFAASLAAVQKMKLDGLVIIGGDDSNTNAAVLAEYFSKSKCQTKVIGVPKTIDGDLKNEYVSTPFGFDTASKTYAEIIGNIARDALSGKKYYHFIKLMGRSASHIALECALATQPNLTLISEEVADKKMTLVQITHAIADLTRKRAQIGKHHGVILIPEGLIEFIPEIAVLIKELNQIEQDTSKLTPSSQNCFASLPKAIQQQLLYTRDPHGNVPLSLIETERLLMELVAHELGGKFAAVPHFLGYEGRAAFPSHFDSNYCYALGMAAALLVDAGRTGYMAFISHLHRPVQEWGMGGVPLTALLHIEQRKGKERAVIQKALVDLRDKPFLHFQQQRTHWMAEDAYRYPGPIQFYGDPELTERIPLTLLLES
jgi:pyrophosphate--fructose-6-phosphate 1-phosphotransferase